MLEMAPVETQLEQSQEMDSNPLSDIKTYFTIPCDKALIEKYHDRQFVLGGDVLTAEEFFSDAAFMPFIEHLAFERMKYLLPLKSKNKDKDPVIENELGIEKNPAADGLFGIRTEIYFNQKWDALLFPLIVSDYVDKLLGNEMVINVDFIYNFCLLLQSENTSQLSLSVDCNISSEMLLVTADMMRFELKLSDAPTRIDETGFEQRKGSRDDY